MVRGIYCLNTKCRYYFEENCTHMFEKYTISVDADGKCYTFEEGVCIGYITDEKWDDAINHVKMLIQMYIEIGLVGVFGLSFLNSYVKRYESGERTEELYNLMISSE